MARTRRSGLAESFNLDNYRASSNTNGTQTRRDVNRAYTQPTTLPTIGNRARCGIAGEGGRPRGRGQRLARASAKAAIRLRA